MSVGLALAESGLLPDSALRWGIRRLLAARLRQENRGNAFARQQRYRQLLCELSRSPVALHPELANAQHYELPPGFFRLVLGQHLKYSACLWPPGTPCLDTAEARMLQCYAERAELAPGQRILDLGCGWGSFTLWAAARFPDCTITAVSNSRSQIEFVRAEAERRGFYNVTVAMADVNDAAFTARFDRVVSVEMFEHVRNYRTLLGRISDWLEPGGKLFVHIFCHRELMYPFETESDDDWMGRYFFTGGLMPAAETLAHFQDDLRLEQQWLLDGRHYQRTARAWLERFDSNTYAIESILAGVYGPDHVPTWMRRWRMFFMACEELFGYGNGTEWLVAHYRFVKPDGATQ
jgi:cyclopropane-fatty-acyl-phospholipid synthase